LDEAYSLTTWESSRDEGRVLSGYSGEAMAEVVAFLSQRVGATVLVAAGYERQMLNDFLPSNEGLRRRFPYMIWLSDYSAEELIDIYLKSVAVALSDPHPAPPLTHDVVRSYYTTTALAFLTDVLTGACETTTNGARHPLLSALVAAQAGFAVQLASTSALLIASSKRRGDIGIGGASGSDTWAIGYMDVRAIWETLLSQQLGPQVREALGELDTIATEAGWRTEGGAWQVPPAPSARLRERRGAR
jgi:hypothetical protein